MKNKFIFYLFLSLLFLPVLTFPLVRDYIDSENHENRTFAEKPEISINTMTSFPEQFDNYFNDYLPYKNQLVMLNNVKNEMLGVGTTALEYRTSSIVIRGKENWLFYNALSEDENAFDDYMCNNLYEESKLAEIASGYTMLQQELKKYGSELVILYAANKEQVYSEYMPSNMIPVSSYSRTDQLVDYLRQNTDVPLLYTKNALLEEKEHQLFYKYDTHWNNLGGFVGAQLINEYFHNEYVSLDEVSYSAQKENMSGDLADLLSMRKIYKDDIEWQVDNYKEDVTIQMIAGDEDKDVYEFASNAADDRSVLVIMDSFGRAMMETLPKDFSEVVFSKDTANFKNYCEQMKPDIVIVEMVERRRGAQESWCNGLYQLLAVEE